jgi:hypothetical protein
MGNVYDYDGRNVGSVNAWSGVHDASGRKVGSMDSYSNRGFDASGRCVGTSDWHGNVHDASGRYEYQVAFFGCDTVIPSRFWRSVYLTEDSWKAIERVGRPEREGSRSFRAILKSACLSEPRGSGAIRCRAAARRHGVGTGRCCCMASPEA